MIQLKALGIKFIAISVVILSTFGMINATTIPNLLLMSITMTAATYLIGDLLVLKTAGNLTATLSDFALVFAGLWLLGNISIGAGEPIFALSFIAAFFISFVEPFVHQMIIEQGGKEARSVPDWDSNMQTEFSEELSPQEQTEKQRKQSDDDI